MTTITHGLTAGDVLISSCDHVENSHSQHEDALGTLYAGLDRFQSGGTVEDLRESDPKLLGELESLGLDPDSTYPDDRIYSLINEFSLGHNVERILTIWLAAGGPNIWLEARLDHRGGVTDVTHHAAWGGDRRSRTVEPGSALWRYAEDFAEFVN